jgi:predicted metal-dependent phosphoesterase TrpH
MTDEEWSIKEKILSTKYKLQQAEEKRDWESRSHLAEQMRMLTEIYEDFKKERT